MPNVPTEESALDLSAAIGKAANTDIVHFKDSNNNIGAWIDYQCIGQGGLARVAPGSLTSIQYVSLTGNDLSDGLTWQTAKLTISGALVALPGGSAGQCGTGIVYAADGVSAHPSIGTGVWLMTSSDPNFSNPPVGWLKAPGVLSGSPGLTIIGVGQGNYGPTPHIGKSAVNLGGNGAGKGTNPVFWFSGNGGPIYIANIFAQNGSQAWRIGVDSNNAITPSASGCVGMTFINCTGNSETNSLPAWTIGGESFWIELVDCGATGNIGQNGLVAADDNAQAILIDGRGSSGGQIINFKGLTNLSQGGIKFYAGTNGNGVIAIDDCTEEGAFGSSSPVAPVLWMAGGPSNNIARVTNALIADGGSTPMAAVQNDMGPQCQVFVTNAWGVVINTQGPVISCADFSFNYQNMTKSALQQGAAGFFGGWSSQFYKVAGLKDDVRRQFLSFSRFVNSVSQLPASWSAFNGGGITSGITGPDGSTNAARVTTSIDGGGVQFLRNNINYSVGDWIVIGTWARANAGTGMIQVPIQFQMISSGFTFVGGANQINGGSYILGDGEWVWVMAAAKVATIGTNPSDTEFLGLIHPANVLDYAYPLFWHIPTGTISDNDVYEVIHALSSNRDDAPSGSVSTQRGLKFMTDGLQMPKITTSVSAPGAEMGFLRWEAGANSGTLKLVAYAGTSATGVTVVDNVGAGN